MAHSRGRTGQAPVRVRADAGRSYIAPGILGVFLALLTVGLPACGAPGSSDERCRQLAAGIEPILTDLEIPDSSMEQNSAGPFGCIMNITIQKRIGSSEAYVFETLQLRVISDRKLLQSEWALLEDQSIVNVRYRGHPEDPQSLQWLVEHENEDAFAYWGARKTKN